MRVFLCVFAFLCEINRNLAPRRKETSRLKPSHALPYGRASDTYFATVRFFTNPQSPLASMWMLPTVFFATTMFA